MFVRSFGTPVAALTLLTLGLSAPGFSAGSTGGEAKPSMEKCAELVYPAETSAHRYALVLEKLVERNGLADSAIEEILKSEHPINPITLNGVLLDAQNKFVFQKAFDRIINKKDLNWDAVKEQLNAIIATKSVRQHDRNTANDKTAPVLAVKHKETFELDFGAIESNQVHKLPIDGPKKYVVMEVDKTIRVVNLETHSLVTMPRQFEITRSLHLLRRNDGKIVLAGIDGENIVLVDADTGEATQLLNRTQIPAYVELVRGMGFRREKPQVWVTQDSAGEIFFFARDPASETLLRVNTATKQAMTIALPKVSGFSNSQFLTNDRGAFIIQFDYLNSQRVVQIVDAFKADSTPGGQPAGVLYSFVFEKEHSEIRSPTADIHQTSDGRTFITIGDFQSNTDLYYVAVAEKKHGFARIGEGFSRERTRPFLNGETGKAEVIVSTKAELNGSTVSRLVFRIADLESVTQNKDIAVREVEADVKGAPPIERLSLGPPLQVLSLPKEQKTLLIYAYVSANATVVDLSTGQLIVFAAKQSESFLWGPYVNAQGSAIAVWGPRQSPSKTLEPIQVYGPLK